MSRSGDDEDILLPHEAAAVLGVTSKTLARWAAAGKVPCITTLGGHRRFRVADIEVVRAKQRATLQIPEEPA